MEKIYKNEQPSEELIKIKQEDYNECFNNKKTLDRLHF